MQSADNTDARLKDLLQRCAVANYTGMDLLQRFINTNDTGLED